MVISGKMGMVAEAPLDESNTNRKLASRISLYNSYIFQKLKNGTKKGE
jgi:hypothetical protein